MRADTRTAMGHIVDASIDSICTEYPYGRDEVAGAMLNRVRRLCDVARQAAEYGTTTCCSFDIAMGEVERLIKPDDDIEIEIDRRVKEKLEATRKQKEAAYDVLFRLVALSKEAMGLWRQ